MMHLPCEPRFGCLNLLFLVFKVGKRGEEEMEQKESKATLASCRWGVKADFQKIST